MTALQAAFYDHAWPSIDRVILRTLDSARGGIISAMIGIRCNISHLTTWQQRREALGRLEASGHVARRRADDGRTFSTYEITAEGRRWLHVSH